MSFSPTSEAFIQIPRLPDGIEIIWIADKTIYADSFPVLINSSVNRTTNLSFKTSYTSFSITTYLDSTSRIFWIPVPDDTQAGTDFLEITTEDRNGVKYNFKWEKSQPFIKDPHYITYTYEWFSHLVGVYTLIGEYSDNDDYRIDFNRKAIDVNEEFVPYNSNFIASGDYDYSSILSKINLTNAHKFQSWKYQSDEAVCDGKGYSEEVILGYEERVVSVEYIIDDDSCSETISAYSDSSINSIFQSLNSTTRGIIGEVGTEHESEAIFDFRFWGFSFIVLIILRKVRQA